MEILETTKRKIEFVGKGEKLFGIYMLNILLTIITLGIYYPWAKRNTLVYLYEETLLDNNRFTFHGTGAEMFKGFIKAILIFGALNGMLTYGTTSGNQTITIVTTILYFIGFIILIPFAIHGTAKYRLSRSSLKGIHFGYRGDRADLIELFIVGSLLSIITLGIYTPWFIVKLRKYIIGNMRYGNVTAEYKATGEDLFLIYVKGFFFTILTVGIYYFWFAKNQLNFYINNTKIHQDSRVIHLKSTITAGGIFKLLFINALLVIFTLGFGTPWAITRTFDFMFSNIILEGELDLNAIKQTEEDYKNAIGEDISDMMDFQL